MPEEMKGRKGFTYPNPILLEKVSRPRAVSKKTYRDVYKNTFLLKGRS